MSKEGVLYISGVKRRTEYIWRAFAAKNELTLSEIADLASHLMVSYDSMQLFQGRNKEFRALDDKLREILESEFPESYRKIPVLRRMFGNILIPITRKDLELIDRKISEEEDVEREDMEIPEVEMPGEDEEEEKV